MIAIERQVNRYRNGVTGEYYHLVVTDGPHGELDENSKFLTIVFQDEHDGAPINQGCVATFRLSDLKELDVDGEGVHAVSAWKPEWAYEKAAPLIKEYYARRDERLGITTVYNCPRCHQAMEEVGLIKKLRCTNDGCAD